MGVQISCLDSVIQISVRNFLLDISLDKDYLLRLVALLLDELFPDEDEDVLDDFRLEEDVEYEFDRLLELEFRG